MVARIPVKDKVVGSNPTAGAPISLDHFKALILYINYI